MARGYPDFEGAKSKLFTVADWAALEATDKNLSSLGGNKGYGGSLNLDYTVPSDKTLYIVGASFMIYAETSTDYDHFLLAVINLVDNTAGVTFARYGGLGGGVISLNKPFVVSADSLFRGQVINFSNITCTLSISAWGYEI